MDLALKVGETVGIAGESGSGKTSLGKILAGILPPDEGSVLYNGIEIARMERSSFRRFRRDVQMMFQDPEGALNPVKTIERQFFEVCRLIGRGTKVDARRQTEEILRQVGLSSEILCRFPGELSGGQNQRVAFGKILLIRPKVIILDEPTSALDVSVQAYILHLLKRLKELHSLSYIFISHDKEVLEFMCDRIVPMPGIRPAPNGPAGRDLDPGSAEARRQAAP